MKQGFERPPLHLVFQNARHIPVRFARMDYQRQACLPRRRDVGAKALRLRRPRTQVVMVIQPRLADSHHLGMLGKFNKFGNCDIQFLMRVVRMGSHRAENIGVVLGDAQQPLEFLHLRADGNHQPHARGFRIGQDFRKAFRQPFVIEMAVAIDNQKAQLFAGASPSST